MSASGARHPREHFSPRVTPAEDRSGPTLTLLAAVEGSMMTTSGVATPLTEESARPLV